MPRCVTSSRRWCIIAPGADVCARASPNVDDLGFVELHQPRVAGDIGREDGGKPLRKVRGHASSPRLGARDYNRAGSTLTRDGRGYGTTVPKSGRRRVGSRPKALFARANALA